MSSNRKRVSNSKKRFFKLFFFVAARSSVCRRYGRGGAMSAYCLRVFRGRARLRHPVLADAAVRQSMADSLALLDGVAGVSQGYSSVLLELKPDADPEAIRRALRAAVPAEEESEERSECVRHGIGARRIELRVLLLSCLACGLFGAAGRISAHIAAGAFSGLLLTHHVWERRHSL